MKIIIDPKKSLIVLSLIIGLLALTNTIALIAEFGFDLWVFGLVPMFKLTCEGNIPTLFSSTIWLITSLLLFLISLKQHANKELHLKQ